MIEVIFVTLTEHTSAITNDTLGPQKYPYHWKLLQGYTSMHRHGTKTTMIFLSADREASWLLLSRSVSLLSGSTVQPENTYSCILYVTGQV